MELPYRHEPRLQGQDVAENRDVSRIQSRDFIVAQTPESKVCKECDLRRICTIGGLVE